MENKKKIRITKIADKGRIHEWWCNNHLMLRTARQVGDTEVVNHYVLGRLNRNKSEVEYEYVSE